MNIFKKDKIKVIPIHILLWVGVWFFFRYFFGYNTNDAIYVTWFSSILLPLTILITYFVNYYLIPKYLLDKQYWKFALYSFYTLVFSSYLIVLIIYGCLIFLLKFNISIMPPMSKNFVFVLIMVFLVVGIVSFFNILNQNLKAVAKNKELQNKILSTQLQLKEQELHYLKMQIHPHFLFNTLNTIYGYALKQSKQTPEIILKLSNLLDYILYQVDKPKVSLKEEILHIKEYVELEKIRFKDNLKVSFNSGSIDEKQEIAPMLLIPFVENAFKHGNLIDGKLKISINIINEDNKLDFEVENTAMNNEERIKNSGIGLENISKRLKLYYHDQFELKTEHKNNVFYAKLIIPNLKLFKSE